MLLTNFVEIIEKILGMCTDACRPQARVLCTFLLLIVDYIDSTPKVIMSSCLLMVICVHFASFHNLSILNILIY